jgi:hypothetical protein
MFKNRFSIFDGLFWLCILVEPFLLTVWSKKAGLLLSPVIWLIAALIPALILLFRYGNKIAPLPDASVITRNTSGLWAIFSGGLLLCSIELSKTIARFEVSPLNSDILPSLKLYVTRFLAGTDPYAPMEFPGWTVMPNYFTLRWFPFIPAELFKFDYRWIGFIVLTAVFWYYTVQVLKRVESIRAAILPVVAPWLMLFVFMQHDIYAFGNAVETLIASYYLVLGFSLFRKPHWMALGILLCLMSRISFTFWLPMYGLLILHEFGWKKAITTGTYVIAAVALIFVLPYVVPDGGKMFKAGLEYYQGCAIGEWYRQGWQEEGAIPTHLSRGIGFAYYWYKPGEEVHQYALCERSFQMISLALAGLLYAGYWLAKKKAWHIGLYGAVSLKIYLSVFYGFIPIPYHYLFLTPCLLSLVLVVFWLQSRRSV